MRRRIAVFGIAIGLLLAAAPSLARDRSNCGRDIFGKEAEPQVQIEACTRLINEDGGSWLWWVSRGDVYRKHLRQYELAIRDYTQAIALKADLAVAYFHRAESYEGAGRNADAMRDYRAAARFGNQTFRTHANAALRRLGAPPVDARQSQAPDNVGCGGIDEPPQQQIAACTRLINSGAENAYYWRISRAHVYKDKLRQYARAVADYTAAIAMRPQHGATYYYRATSYEALGRRAEAISDYRMVTQLEDEGFGVHAKRALARLGDKASKPAVEAQKFELIRKAQANELDNGFCAQVRWPQIGNEYSDLLALLPAAGGMAAVRDENGCSLYSVSAEFFDNGRKKRRVQWWHCKPSEKCEAGRDTIYEDSPGSWTAE